MERLRQLIDKHTGYLLLLPALFASLFVHIYPSLDAARMSFFDIRLLNPARPFIGLANYAAVLQDPVFGQTFANTIVWTLLSLILSGALGLLAAVCLNRPRKGRGLLRALFLVPWITPPFVVAIVFRSILSETFSPVSGMLMRLGIITRPINFLGNTETWLGIFSIPMLTIIMINVWCTFSFMMVMFLAGLQTIPPELYEAAEVDGASRRVRFFRITLPSLLPVLEATILLEGIWQFNNFNISYLVTRGGPLNLTEVMSVQVYTEAFNNFRYGYAAAISVFMLLAILAPAILYVRRSIAHA